MERLALGLPVGVARDLKKSVSPLGGDTWDSLPAPRALDPFWE